MSDKNKENSEDKYNVEATSKNDLTTSAATEPTGLIPSLPASESELEAYKDIFPFCPDEFIE